MSFFTKIRDKIEEFFEDSEKAVVDFLEELAASIFANGKDVLITSAVNAVKAAEEQGGGSEAKFQAAFAAVAEELKTAGIPVVVNAVNGAIEAAVAKLHHTTAAAAGEDTAAGGDTSEGA